MTFRGWTLRIVLVGGLFAAPFIVAQPEPFPQDKPPMFGGGPGGPGGPIGQQRKLVKQFDKDGDGRLNADERKAAREWLKKDKEKSGNKGFGPGFGRGRQDPPKPGPKMSPTDVKAYPDSSLYEPSIVRTLFLEFEGSDWEAEMADFYHTDVEIPATLTVDGRKYKDVGVHFRGASSFFGVGAGFKRSMNLTMDFVDHKQKLYGTKTLNLLNSHDDPSHMSTVLYSHIGRQYLPTPKSNFVKLVVNSEYWGVYVNAQQFNKEFIAENFPSAKGARWKVKGSPGGGGGLDYVGDKPESYKRRYEIKSNDDDASWEALITLCKTLSKTPIDQLEQALKPMLDIESALWFLAMDNAVINNDGYWVRASDYSLYMDPKGVFHVIPHDMNECFGGVHGPPGMGMLFGGPPGGFPKDGPPKDGPPRDDPKDQPKEKTKDFVKGRGPGGGRPATVELDPLIGMNDAKKPLRSRLLAVPSLRAKYLDHVKTIADKSLDWKTLGPVVAQYRSLIEKDLEMDTRKLTSIEAFRTATADKAELDAPARNREVDITLRAFADRRREYLLNFGAIKALNSETPKSGAD